MFIHRMRCVNKTIKRAILQAVGKKPQRDTLANGTRHSMEDGPTDAFPQRKYRDAETIVSSAQKFETRATKAARLNAFQSPLLRGGA